MTLPALRKALGRSGFIMIFTMVAVAITGYLLVESSPDFSNYALLSRSEELDTQLSEIRRAVRSQPYILYTTVGDLCAGTVLTTEEFVKTRLTALSVPHGSERASFLSTIPRDPYVPINQWYDSTSQQGVYWSLSYNMVRNGTFASDAYKEGYEEDPFDILFVKVTGDREEIWKTGALGVPVPAQALISIPLTDLRDPQISPDGSRFLYVKHKGTSSEIWAANVSDGRSQTKITTGTGQSFDTPRWTPSGNQVLYRNAGTNVFEVKGLREDTPAYRFPFDLEKVSNPAWSPNGRFLAYIGQSGGSTFMGIQEYGSFGVDFTAGAQEPTNYLNRFRFGLGDERFADQEDANRSSRTIDPSGIRSPGGSLPNRIPARPVTPVWSPYSGAGQLVYSGTDNALHLLDLTTLTDRALDPVGGGKDVTQIAWLPSSVQGSRAIATNWLAVSRSADPPGLFRRRLDDGVGQPYSVANLLPTSFSVSRAGTRIAVSSDGETKLHLVHVDGADRGLGKAPIVAQVDTTGDCAEGSLAGSSGDTLHSPTIGPPRSVWSFPAANVSIIDTGEQNRFDPDVWREFVMRNQHFEGDNRFGGQWLRIEPPARTNNILFDNGESTFMISRLQPTVPGASHGDNIEPSWSPRGQTWVGREARSAIPGEQPVNIFKVPFRGGSATTVRVTTGIEPAVSPDDTMLAMAQGRGRVTTFPPDGTLFPIDNTDLVIASVSGSVDPPIRVLTPDSNLSQERAPAWSPDGKYIYYQREIQEAPSLATHGSSIYRVTRDGGVQTEIQGMEPGNIDGVTTRFEYYYPAVSPDGTRLAFIGKERLRSVKPGLADSGSIISETLFVKDLLTNGTPTALLRFAHPNHPLYLADSTESMWSLASPSWSPDGEEIILLRYQDNSGLGALRFPRDNIYTWDTNGDGVPYSTSDRFSDGSGGDGHQEIIRVLASDPAFLTPAKSVRKNYEVLVSTLDSSPHLLDLGSNPGKTKRRIFNPRVAPGATVIQRIAFGDPQAESIGVSMGDVWYVLSGFVRTSPGSQDVHAAQITLQLLDKNGLLVDQAQDKPPIFQAGILDVGAERWTRFSQALNFGTPSSGGPYTLCLLLYTLGSIGSYADFTGISLERAHDPNKPYPTRFGLGRTLFSPSTQADPRLPEALLFER